MKRHPYSMPSYAFVPMRIGQLMCLQQCPVLAADSVSLDLGFIIRMSPLRRQLTLDAKLSVCAFWIPDRHFGTPGKDANGNDLNEYVNFLRQGVDEDITLPTINFTDQGNPPLGYLGYPAQSNTVFAKPYYSGINRIWNRYFRKPSDRIGKGSIEGQPPGYGEWPDNLHIRQHFTGILTTQNLEKYGPPITWKPNHLTAGMDTSLEAADYEVDIMNGKLDIRELNKQMARYGSEQGREYFVASDDRYKDILNFIAGSGNGVNIDADERPELIMHEEYSVGGHDVEGTGDTSLGDITGRGIFQGAFSMPKKFFREPGTIYVMAYLRYPQLVRLENHYLQANPQPSYKEKVGDPRIISEEPPTEYNLRDYSYFDIGSNPSLGEHPYGQHLRCMPTANIHIDYGILQGFPFLELTQLGNYKLLHYINSAAYDSVFDTTQLQHANINAKLGWHIDRLVPPGTSSIFAGAK